MNKEAVQKETTTLELEPLLMHANMLNSGDSYDIAILANYPDTDETRMLLTPEACGLLTSSGLKVAMEEGAGVDISFSDDAYAEYGVKIVSREEALGASMVLSFSPLRTSDILLMKPGSSLLCTMASGLIDKDSIKALLDMDIPMG